MIGMAGENRQGAVGLFGGHDAGQLMRPGHRAEGDQSMRLGAQFGVETVRPAKTDDKG